MIKSALGLLETSWEKREKMGENLRMEVGKPSQDLDFGVATSEKEVRRLSDPPGSATGCSLGEQFNKHRNAREVTHSWKK